MYQNKLYLKKHGFSPQATLLTLFLKANIILNYVKRIFYPSNSFSDMLLDNL